jgi:LPXTG-motif cell wall-anchored protein
VCTKRVETEPDETAAACGARSRRIDIRSVALALSVVVLLVFAGNGRAPAGDAAPPPPGAHAHGAAGSGRNGFGGEIAPSPTMRSWPGTGSGGNGGPFAFIGAHYGALWQMPPAHNNSQGVGYCVMEDVAGEGAVSLRPDPAAWDPGEMARAAALMSSFGGDRVVPYGIDAGGPYDVASGEWRQPTLLGGGEYTRRRHVAVNFGVKMFLDDVSPSGAVAGLKLARDASVVNGSGGEFSALRHGYAMAQHMATVAEIQHAVGGVRLQMVWSTPDATAPTRPGTYSLTVHATDTTGKPVGYIPIVAMSDIGIDGARTIGAAAAVDRTGDTADDTARRHAATALGWPTMEMAASMAADPRFALLENPSGADIADAAGNARFTVDITSDIWSLGFHTQAPTADVALYSGTGVQGQATWAGRPQSASTHVAVDPVPPTVPTTTPATTSSTTSTSSTSTTTAPPPPPSTTTPSTTTTTPSTTTPSTTPSTTTPSTNPSTSVPSPSTPPTTPPTTSPAPPSNTTPIASPAPPGPPATALPRTGADSSRSLILAAVASLTLGVALVSTARRRVHRNR